MAEPVIPSPVVIAVEEQKPVPVVIEASAPAQPGATVTKGEGTTLSPTTTEEGDRVTAGQRHISRVWEYTQAILAVTVVTTTIYVLAVMALSFRDLSPNSLLIVSHLVVMATYIVTSYYQRTNHTREGGIGPKASEEYKGR